MQVSSRLRARARVLAALALPIAGGLILLDASDHSDAPSLGTLVRQDANLSDFHAFVAGPNLVLALSTNPAIPRTATSYIFPADVTFDIHVDVDSPVGAADPFGDGGTILDPRGIREDISFRIRFREDGTPRVQRIARGVAGSDAQVVNFFAGLRDDPFVRIPRDGRNVGAIVLEVPLASVVESQPTLLLWATSKVEEFEGPFQELAGRSLRSMFPEQLPLDGMAPRLHVQRMGLRPDVMIYDTSRPAGFPNGRALTDDVILRACVLGGECRVFDEEQARWPDLRPDLTTPRSNDLPFRMTFPYLAPPHPAP